MYLPLSRKYRPQVFDEIIGQDHITTTLKNAVSMDKLAHAYLFSGSRGVGKTSTARVFAKALNCEKGPTEKPCLACAACVEITKGVSLDVLEIDGASNRGIDEIRNLRENVKLMPVSGKYRIYIIDEVHMLTPEAFNALLKTLEEPPLHVKFIFATTRAYKIPSTIMSRCQRFDFRMIPVPVIAGKLKEIAAEENLKIQEDSAFLIARSADGSLRDALTMFDQLVSFTKGRIRAEDISKMFGMLEQDTLVKVTEAVLKNDGPAIITLVDEMISSGKEAVRIASSLIEHFRNLMVISLCGESSGHVFLSQEDRSVLSGLSRRFSVEELFYAVYTLSNAMDLIGKTSLGKVPLEVALLKLSRKEKLVPIDEVLKKLSRFEGLIKKGNAPLEPLFRNESVPSEENNEFINGSPFKDNGDIKPSGGESAMIKEGPADQDVLFQRVRSAWPEIVREVKSKKMSVGSYLEEGEPLELNKNNLIIGFSKSNSLHREVLDSKAHKDIITGAIKHLLELEVALEFATSLNPVNENEDAAPAADISERSAKKVEPIIESAVDVFKGRIIEEYRK